MKITNIKQQVRHPLHYSIFIDSRFAFSLSEVALIESKIVVGQELLETQLARLEKMSATDRIYTNTLRFVALRARSEWEVRTYLRRKKIDDLVEKDIIERLRRIGLIDDKSFARSWVASRRLLRSTGKRRLVQELKQKHIDEPIIDQVLNEDETDEYLMLKQLVERKRRLSRYQHDDLKLMQYLTRQGYDYSAIKSVLSDIQT